MQRLIILNLLGLVAALGALAVPVQAASADFNEMRAELRANPDDLALWQEALQGLFIDGMQAESLDEAMRLSREQAELTVERLSLDAAGGRFTEASAKSCYLMNVRFDDLLLYYEDGSVYALGEKALAAYRTLKPRAFVGHIAYGMLAASLAEHTKDAAQRRALFDEAHAWLAKGSSLARQGGVGEAHAGFQMDLMRLGVYGMDARISAETVRKATRYAQGLMLFSRLEPERAALEKDNSIEGQGAKVKYDIVVTRFFMNRAADASSAEERDALLGQALARLEVLGKLYQGRNFLEREEIAAIRGDAKECLSLLQASDYEEVLPSYPRVTFYAYHSSFIRLIAEDPGIKAFFGF